MLIILLKKYKHGIYAVLQVSIIVYKIVQSTQSQPHLNNQTLQYVFYIYINMLYSKYIVY